ncbi:MAG: sn-glycerol-1-phosphate dehydrogenase [Halanaerobiaceae bacterium]|nr:sn-glycerol-1-phosphate dehydrogenase [Halanaerobiaceae bacterium]
MIAVNKNQIKEIIIKEAAISELPALLTGLTRERKVYLIVDKNTYQAAGSSISMELKKTGFQVEEVFLKGEKIVANTDYFFKLLKELRRDGYFLACGSGTINDLARFVSFKLEKPYVIAATAPSMDGYASHVSPITVDGIKETYNAVTPEAIVADLDVLKTAPWEMIQAGFGDLLGKISALLDWKLSNILFGVELHQEAVSLVEGELRRLIALRADLRSRTTESIETLTKGLVNSGIAMQLVGNSRPASGAEHHISHFLEMYGEIHGVELPPHGIKVALGEYFVSRLYLKLYELDFAGLVYIDDYERRRERIRENYLERAVPVLETLEERWNKEQLDTGFLRSKEREIKSLIEENMEYLQEVEDCLKETGILEREDIRAIDRGWLFKAVQSSFEIRNRYTVAVLLSQVGLLEEWSHELVDDFEKLIS